MEARVAYTASRVPVSTCVLVVEDDAAMRGMLAEILGAEGYEVITATDGEEALRLLYEDPRGADVVVTDHRMPNMTGLDLAERVRRTPGWTPVVMVSAFADERLAERARRLGVTRVLEKPFDANDLLGVVRQLVPLVY